MASVSLQLRHTSVTDLPASAGSKPFGSNGNIELSSGLGSETGVRALLHMS